MKSYTALRNLYGAFTQNTSTDNLALGDQLINDEHRRLLRKAPWLLEGTWYDTTVASQQFYTLPPDYGKLINATVTIGSFSYTPQEVPSRDFWDKLNLNTVIKSNIPQWRYIYNKQLGLWPTPSANGSTNNIAFNYQKRIKDLNAADYTTGTVSISNASLTVTGTATFTAAMVGRYIRVDESAGGDEEWYEISGYTNATTLTLKQPYQGATVSGATYTIGQMPLLPEEYQDIPVYFAASVYWQTRDEQRYQQFLDNYRYKHNDFLKDYRLKSSSVILDIGKPQTLINPNLTITQ